MHLIDLCERGWIPDFLTRFGIRYLIRERLAQETAGNAQQQSARFERFLSELTVGPIAVNTRQANEQHYEVPAEFFRQVLGARLKYSACLFPTATTSLDEAEEHMLALSCERAQLGDGQRILELGCGWGSLTLWMAERYPQSNITAVSNSNAQREFIEARAAQHGLTNVQVITKDINDFSSDEKFDRIVSIEMFEHMRNYHELLKRIAGWLVPDGKLFVHIFCHKTAMYPFEVEGQKDWMAKYFFTGGIMPSRQTLAKFDEHMRLVEQWDVPGWHYERTSNAWLAEQDKHREPILALFAEAYGSSDAAIWFQRWRMFFMACAELFGINNGDEWFVGHFLLEKK